MCPGHEFKASLMKWRHTPPEKKKKKKNNQKTKPKGSGCGGGAAGGLAQRAQRLEALAVFPEVLALIPRTNVVAHCCL